MDQVGARSTSDRRLGAVIAGRYRIERLLAKGGMGAVYYATQLALRRPVAIKFMSSLQEEVELRARFNREAETMGQLGHPLRSQRIHSESRPAAQSGRVDTGQVG